jgi:hypothetical protein
MTPDARAIARLPEMLKLLLRVMGTSSLTALIFVAAPREWMRDIHEWLGMGPLPEGPVVWYLARSTSFFYALVGGLFWLVSFDLPRHRQIVIFLGVASTLLGVALTAIDWAEGLPFFWKVWEGPFVIAFGLTVCLLARSLPRWRDER